MNKLIRICLYGPESVGKTTLARQLAAHYGEPWVPEVARAMIPTDNVSLTADDYVRIGRAQTEAVLRTAEHAKRLLICDTDVITTQLYAQIYLGHVPPELLAVEQQLHYDRFFLLDIDVPWVADGLRDLGHRRAEVFQLFKEALEQRSVPFVLVSGTWEQRRATVMGEVSALLND